MLAQAQAWAEGVPNSGVGSGPGGCGSGGGSGLGSASGPPQLGVSSVRMNLDEMKCALVALGARTVVVNTEIVLPAESALSFTITEPVTIKM